MHGKGHPCFPDVALGFPSTSRKGGEGNVVTFFGFATYLLPSWVGFKIGWGRVARETPFRSRECRTS